MVNPLKCAIPLAMMGLAIAAVPSMLHAQDTSAEISPEQEQKEAKEIVTKMTMAQNDYYQKDSKFKTVIDDIVKDLDLTLTSSYNYGIRTTPEAAYVYVMPAKTSMADQLKAYVGIALVNPEQDAPLMTLVCESTKAGRLRPSDPKIVKQKGSDKETVKLECGDASVPVSNTSSK